MHDGSNVLLRKLDPDYDPTDRVRAAAYVQERAQRNEYVTGLIHVDTSRRDFHEQHGTSESALNAVPVRAALPRRREARQDPLGVSLKRWPATRGIRRASRTTRPGLGLARSAGT